MEQSAQNKLPDWEIKWQFCKPLIEPALKHQDSYTIDDVEDKIRSGYFHLWPGEESAFITEFIIMPRMRALNLIFPLKLFDITDTVNGELSFVNSKHVRLG